MRATVVATVFAAILVVRSNAAAADLLDGSLDLGFVRAGTFGTVSSLPGLAINGADAPRRIVGAPIPSSNPVWYGVEAAFAIRANFLTWDLLSLRYSASNIAFDGGSTANGQPFFASASDLRSVEIGVPLCGLPSGFAAFLGADGRTKLAFALDVGFDHLWAAVQTESARVAKGAAASIDDWSAYLRVSGSLCRRLGRWTGEDVVAWFCFVASPKLVDGNGSSGVSLGARIEL